MSEHGKRGGDRFESLDARAGKNGARQHDRQRTFDRVEDQDGGATVKYQLVGDDEADIKQGLLSVSSPIARALIGKSEGDVVDVKAPGGTRSYEIVSVRYV